MLMRLRDMGFARLRLSRECTCTWSCRRLLAVLRVNGQGRGPLATKKGLITRGLNTDRANRRAASFMGPLAGQAPASIASPATCVPTNTPISSRFLFAQHLAD